MKRAATALSLLWLLMPALPAAAANRQASIGNYWYEEDGQRDQTKIVVRQGDQITFTVREAAVPGHTVDVDALNIHSPNLNIGQTYTTPPLNRTGNFYLYCRPHEQRGHHTRLVVVAAQQATPQPEPARTPTTTKKPGTPPAAKPSSTPAPSATRKPSAPPTLAPVGVGTAPPGALDRPVPTDPNSLEALTGRTRAQPVPWTRSLWWLLIATVPIVGASLVALRRARVAVYQPKVENLRRARAAIGGTKPKSATRKAKPKSAAKKPQRRR